MLLILYNRGQLAAKYQFKNEQPLSLGRNTINYREKNSGENSSAAADEVEDW